MLTRGTLWHVELPGGYRTAHQARPIDIDGDGLDEIMAGCALLNPDGSVRWVYESRAVDPNRGHLDAMRVLRSGPSPEEWRLAMSLCGAGNLAVVDGNGKIVWEVPGHHFESLDIGRFCPDVEGPQIAVDIDQRALGQSPVVGLRPERQQDQRDDHRVSRSHRLIDWDGSGVSALAIARPRGCLAAGGERLATFDLHLPNGEEDVDKVAVASGDMNGDGVVDLLFNTEEAAYIFLSPAGRPVDVPLGSGPNFTYY